MYKNKFIISSALGLALMFTAMHVYAVSTGVINTETVKMRSKASTDSNIVMLVSQDDKVEIIEESGDWYKVKFDGNTGYIFAKYVTTKDNNETKNESEENNTEAEDETASDNTNTADENTTTTNTVEDSTTTEETTNETTDSNSSSTQNTETNKKILLTQDTAIKLIPLITSKDNATIKANTTVTVKENLNGWFYIIAPEAEGWARQEKIDLNNEIKTEEPEKTTTETEEVKEEKAEETEKEETKTTTKYVSTEKVNIRKKASTDSDVVKSITKNTKVTVLSTENGWAKVKVGDTEGYISSTYLSDKKVSEENKNSTNTTNRSLEESRTQATEKSTTSSSNANVVDYAKSYLGSKYVSGGAGPSSFDCSGFTQYIYKNYGVSLAHSASAQAGVGTSVDKSNLQEGDLVLFKGQSGSGIGHVGIYIGGNKFIHASNPTGGVKITSMSDSYYSQRYVTSRRVL